MSVNNVNLVIQQIVSGNILPYLASKSSTKINVEIGVVLKLNMPITINISPKHYFAIKGSTKCKNWYNKINVVINNVTKPQATSSII